MPSPRKPAAAPTDLPTDLAGRVRFDLSATDPYRSYHAFVIQPL